MSEGETMTKYVVYITDSVGTRDLEEFGSLAEATMFVLTMEKILPSAEFEIKAENKETS